MEPKLFFSKYKDLEPEVNRMKKQACKYGSGGSLLNEALKCINYIKQYRKDISESKNDIKNESLKFRNVNLTPFIPARAAAHSLAGDIKRGTVACL